MEKKLGNCRCAFKNPKGKWCLGDVRQVVTKLKGKPAFKVIDWDWDDPKVLSMRTEIHSNDIIILDNMFESLKERFNKNRGKIRFMALLSPTCPLWRDQGARAVQENLFSKYPDADVSGSIVWIPILEKDSIDAAFASAKALSDDRIQHFYDCNKAVGQTIAASVAWQGHVAWDIYLFYGPTVKWAEAPPKPDCWMHQLSDAWAKNDRFRIGDDLKKELSASMATLIRH